MKQGNEQAEFKTKIKHWLKGHGLDYRWVAGQCGVSEITVRNWMSKKNIPPLKQQLLEQVMVHMPESAPPQNPPDAQATGIKVTTTVSLSIQLAEENYHRLAEHAAARNTTMEAVIIEAIQQIIDSLAPPTAPQLRSCKIILPQT